MTFYTGNMFPAEYRGGIFSAQHGSWNRTEPVGARVMFTPVDADGTADEPEPFAEGWLDENGEYLGRPVDVAQLPDGSILVSDDLAGALYRIWYEAPGSDVGAKLRAQVGSSPPGLHGQDVEAGRQVAGMCRTCHGLDGLAQDPDRPEHRRRVRGLPGRPAPGLPLRCAAARNDELGRRRTLRRPDRRRLRLVCRAGGDRRAAAGSRPRGSARGVRRLPRLRRNSRRFRKPRTSQGRTPSTPTPSSRPFVPASGTTK